jgi:hypothetical protein
MGYERKRPFEVEAIRLIRPVYDSEGKRLADTGEWIIIDGKEQYYMKDEDFCREFVKKAPETEIVVETEVQIQTYSYPIYIEKPVWPPCPQPWVRPWYDRNIIWCDSTGYLTSHSSDQTNINKT